MPPAYAPTRDRTTKHSTLAVQGPEKSHHRPVASANPPSSSSSSATVPSRATEPKNLFDHARPPLFVQPAPLAVPPDRPSSSIPAGGSAACGSTSSSTSRRKTKTSHSLAPPASAALTAASAVPRQSRAPRSGTDSSFPNACRYYHRDQCEVHDRGRWERKKVARLTWNTHLTHAEHTIRLQRIQTLWTAAEVD